MARERNQRYGSTLELWQALEQWKGRTGTMSERPPSPSAFQSTNLGLSQPGFGTSSSPALGSASSPGFGTASSPGFGTASSPGFGQQTPPPNANTPYPAPVMNQTPWPAGQAQGATGGNTQNSWGQASQPGVAPIPVQSKSKALLFAAIALGALVVLGGGGFAVSRVVGGGSAAGQKTEETKTDKVEDKKSEDKKAEEKKAEDKKPEEKKPEVAPTADPPKPAETAPVASASAAPKLDPKKPVATAMPKSTAPVATGKPTAAPSGKKPADWGYSIRPASRCSATVSRTSASRFAVSATPAARRLPTSNG